MTAASMFEAGREMDARVAEVMGDVAWDVVIEGCSRGGRRCATVAAAEAFREALRPHYLVGDIVLHDSVPHYSTDIAAACLVVQKMRESGWDFYLRQVAYWTADFLLDRSMIRFTEDADTASLAICRAAVAAVEGGV